MKRLRDHHVTTRRGHIISGVIAAAAFVAVVYVGFAATLHPRTDDAEVVANYIGIAPLVAGPITTLPVQDNQLVPQGGLLYTVDDRPYLYALQNALAAQATLEGEIENETRRIRAEGSAVRAADAATVNANQNSIRSGDEVKVSEAAVNQAEAALKQAQADATYASGNLNRIEPLLVKQFVTPDDVQKARMLAQAKDAAVEQAKASLVLSKAKLLSSVAQQQQALAQVAQTQAQLSQSQNSVLVLAPLIAERESRAAAVRLAQYNYEQCHVVAPFDARVTNLTASEGGYAKIGEQIFTLIDNRRWWVLANFRETQLNHIRQGQKVDIFLMSNAGIHLHGTVESIGHGVTPDPDVVGKLNPGLPDVQRTLNWVRLASRYPVRIRIDDPPTSLLRMGQVAIVRMR